ncbi:MAG: prepilin-type N-terminal cleavage/methylation domain-containing protein [Chloroflexi bacterium]|nr:prepilin-type N-terminal cleavage/methylation domain-containing protein [Chloroflexota bacterium]
MRNQSGFTLIELLAVMAIIAVLAAIIAPAVSGTKDSSVDAAAFADAQRVRDASAEYFKDQNAAEVRTTHTVTLTASTTNSVAAAAGKLASALTATDYSLVTSAQEKSSRWPEKFITSSATATFASLYEDVFTTSGSGGADGMVRRVIILDKDGKAQDGDAFLEGFTAIDVDALKTADLLHDDPTGSALESESGLNGYKVPNFLWVFEKSSSGAESAPENDSRDVAVYKLLKVQKVEPSAGQAATQVDLTYQRIF